MPIYEYKCTKCNLEFEEHREMNSDKLDVAICPLPECKSTAKRIFVSRISLGTSNFSQKTVDVTVGAHADKAKQFFEDRKENRIKNKEGRYIYKNTSSIGGH